MPEQSARVGWVDYAKGLCIIFVVMMHSTLGLEEALGREGWLHAFVSFARPFRMPDFFLVAGLFAKAAIDRNWTTFLDRKVVHFAYFYALWLVIQCALKCGWIEGEGFATATQHLLLGLIEPYSTLWFIYLLPIFFVATRLLSKAPPSVVWVAAALLETLRIKTGWTVIDEFAARYVYFLSGYYFSARVFLLAEWVQGNPLRALAGLVAWGLTEATLVSVPTVARPIAALPGVSLLLGFAGAMAIVAIAALLQSCGMARRLQFCGRNSIVIYLAFFLPMATLRTIIVRFAPEQDVGTASVLITTFAVVVPIAFWAATRHTRLRYLFERPARFRLAPRPAEALGEPVRS